MTKIRAKFMLQERHEISWGHPVKGYTFVFRAQYDPSIPEDRRFAKASPTGELRISVDNPAAIDDWGGKLGQQFYLDFVPVAEPGAEDV